MNVTDVLKKILPKMVEAKKPLFKEWLDKKKEEGVMYVIVLNPVKNYYDITELETLGNLSIRKREIASGKAEDAIENILNLVMQ